MAKREEVSKILSEMTYDYDQNYESLQKFLKDNYGNNRDISHLLFVFTEEKYAEMDCLLAIKSLLKHGANPNYEFDFNYNFIQNALYTGYSESFVTSILGEAMKYNFDINHVDGDGDTIVHTAVYSEDYKGGVMMLYNLACSFGFDSRIRDEEGRNVVDAIEFEQNLSHSFKDEEVEFFRELYNKEMIKLGEKNNNNAVIEYTPIVGKKENDNTLKKVDEGIMKVLSSFGNVLTNKKYFSNPAVGRDLEMKKLMVTLAQDKKNPIIVGESGVGKTAIVDALAYNIQQGNVPSFLKDKIILEVNPNELVAGCKYVGQFEEHMEQLMKLRDKIDFIMFIDEIHTMYGVGSSDKKASDMASMIKRYIDREDLKVIGTTTEEEYQKFFAKDALKRRFEKICVKEPDEEVIEIILDKVMEDYCRRSGLSFENENEKQRIIDIIVDATDSKHRVYDDRVNNPDLAISIIDKAFAFAKVFDSDSINLENFIDSFSCCDRIYDSSKERAIRALSKKERASNLKQAKILDIDFNKFRR